MAVTRGKTTQFIVNLPTVKAKQLLKLATKMGLGEPAFCSVALVLGAQVMERQFNPENFMPQALLDAMVKAGFEIAKDDETKSE